MILETDRKEALRRVKEGPKLAEIIRNQESRRTNPKDLLAEYLRHVDPILRYEARFSNTKRTNEKLDDALLKLLSKDKSKYLDFSGRDIKDLMTWAWILTSETSERAATRLLAVAHQEFIDAKGRRSIPIFVFTLLLRRRNTSAVALRSLLIYAWELLKRSETLLEPLPPLEKLGNEVLQGGVITKTHTVKDPREDKTGIMESVFMIIIIRLLRLARKVWPAACNSVIGLVTRYLDGINFRKGASQTTVLTSEDTARLAYSYNSLLKLVSLSSSIGPFQSAFHQQQAQFRILRRMNAFSPPLIVDRKGYSAVVSTQLRHKKTLKEREWAQMKAKSWPPWKEEKLGIDADVSVEHGTSRALEALRRSWEAGYAPDSWDAVASILSGWDTDRSPTIQTRAVHFASQSLLGRNSKIWVSRIRATRNLGEAWACFLSYKDQETREKKVEETKAFSVYHQMYEKIAEDAKRPPAQEPDSTLTCHTDEHQPLPGDGLEVSAAPESPREAVYVRKPPPTVAEFFKMMVNDNVRPGKQFLNTMFKHAPNLETGLRYLEASNMPRAQVHVLKDMKTPSTPKGQAALESIPHNCYASFIRLLTRFSPTLHDKQEAKNFGLQTGPVPDSSTQNPESTRLDSLQSQSGSEPSLKLEHPRDSIPTNPLLGAVRLVLARKPQYRPAWYHILHALARRTVLTDLVSRSVDQDYEDLKTWQMICRLLNEMLNIDLAFDLEGFHLLCTGLEKAIFASERLSRSLHNQPRNKPPSEDIKSYPDHVLSNGLPLLKEIFKDVVRGQSMQRKIPPSLMEEKSRIDESVEEQNSSDSDVIGDEKKQDEEEEENIRAKPTTEPSAFLPPDCLLPRLLEVPGPACLHAFIRILGLRRDYDGLLDLVEWVSLFADEINAVVDSMANGHRLRRRWLTAIHVFMERSWIKFAQKDAQNRGQDPSTVRPEVEMKAEPAPAGIAKAIRDIVSENKKWGGWPDAQEIKDYCMNGRFI